VSFLARWALIAHRVQIRQVCTNMTNSTPLKIMFVVNGRIDFLLAINY